MNSRSSLKKFAAAVVLLGAGCLALPALAHIPIPPRKGEIGRRVAEKPVADFILTDQDRKKFDLREARGKIVAITFVYTRCPDVCPLFTANFAAIQRALDQRGADYQLLTITTDPEIDTPEQLKSYADLFKPDYRRWRFLTGDESVISRVWKDFGVTVRKAKDGQVQHTALTTILDRQGRRRVDYYGDKWQEKSFLQDMISLGERNLPAD